MQMTKPDPVLTRDAVVALYTRILEAWNRRDAEAFAAQFTEGGNTVGFDGSPLDGSAAISKELSRIFAHHTPATYVGKVREVRPLGDSAMLLRAVAGMVPPNGTAIKPERNAIQSLVAVIDGGEARVALYQNTPARFDGRPQLAEALTTELSAVLESGRVVI
jgi:uncharacterized protein (TIGR02246 family)